MPNIIGTAPNQVPTNSDLGNLAFQNKEAVNVDLIKINTAGAAAGTNQTVGTLSWDDGNGTANIILKGGNVNLQVGQELVARVYNDSGSALTDGQIVYISGAQGNRIAVKLAKADSEATSAGTLGMVTEPIASGAEGFITIMGTVNGLNTSALTAGNLIYLSASTAGAYTTTAPTAPNHRVILGYVERVHATVGSIYVKVDNGYELDELHNVNISSPVNNQVLKFNSSTNTWVNGTETDPVYTASSWYTTTNNSTNWNTAYGWGNHASAGYLTSSAIGTTVQAYDADLTSWAAIAPSAKQDTLVSGTNIKTVNSTSLLGSGNVAVQETLVSGTNIKTINGSSVLGSGDLSLGSGSLVLISKKTASSSADLTWTGLSGYNSYLIIFDNITTTSSNSLISVLLGYGATPTYITSNYFYNWIALNSTTPAYTSGTTSSTGVLFNRSAATNQYWNGYAIMNGATSNSRVVITGHAHMPNTPAYITGATSVATSNPITAIQFKFSTGTIASGSITLYGIAE